MAKLSRALQTEHLNLSVISSLLDATLSSLDDAVIPAANWVLEFWDDAQELEMATVEEITGIELSSFQKRVGKPLVALLKDNITSQFSSSDVVGSFSIFDPKKVPATDFLLFSSYGEESVDITQRTSQQKVCM